MPCLVEVCVDSLESALAAAEGGANRIELCQSLHEGGLTPSHALITIACQRLARTNTKVHVLLRPRPGDFVYNDEELEIIKLDLIHAAACGIDGVVLGILTPAGTIDIDNVRFFVDLCNALCIDFTFHRAFDVIHDKNRLAALNDLISCGVQRLLTSGGAASAMKGLSVIADLVKEGNGRISIMPGGGITDENVASTIVQVTGVSEVHGSFRGEAVASRWLNLSAINPRVHFSSSSTVSLDTATRDSSYAAAAEVWQRQVADADIIRRVVVALNNNLDDNDNNDGSDMG